MVRTVEVQNPDPGERRRFLWLIRKHAKALGGSAYILSVARDRFHLAEGFSVWEDLSTEQLRQLMLTLAARRSTQARTGRAASLDSEESFPDQVEFEPDDGAAECLVPELAPAEPVLAGQIDPF